MVRGAALVLGLACLAPSLALAQGATGDATEEARRHFEAGTEAFDVGEYVRAATEFRTAYDITHHPDLLFNIYSALERAGELEQAADALEGYLRDGDPDEERRTALSARLARLRERLAQARADAAEAELQAERDRAREPQESETPHAPAEPAPADDGGGGIHPAGVGLLIGGGVLLVTFAIVAGLAAAEDGHLADTCSPGCSDDQVATLSTLNLVADVSWIAGAVVAATGLVLLFALPPEGDGASASIAPWAAPGAGGLVAVGRF